MANSGDKTSAWDAHWRTGTLSSLSTGNKTSEAPEAIAAWNRFFEKLPKGALILDLATGNGIVPVHANAYSREFASKFEIMAVDQADIDPLKTVTEGRDLLAGITFIGGINIEDLPFENALFDAVTGQYAVEYTDLNKTAREAARVLKKGGCFRFVSHAKEGVIVSFNAPKARQCRWLLEDSGVFETLAAAARDAFQNAPSREDSRARFRTVAIGAREAIKDMGENEELQVLLQNLVQAYIGRKQFNDFEAFKAWLGGVRDEVEGQVGMIEALAEAALDFKGVEGFAETLVQAGFADITVAELGTGPKKQMLGWQIEGVRT